MLKNNAIILLLILLLFALGCSILLGQEVATKRTALIMEQAIEIGKIELKKMGFDTQNMNVIADEENTAWKEFVSSNPSIMESKNVREMKLSERNYWAIYYTPKERALGGDAWIFIDKKDLKVIGMVLGE